MKYTLLPFFLFLAIVSSAQGVSKELPQLYKKVEGRMIEWRRHFHQYPELSNREFKTGKFIADTLTALGLQVKYPVAKTGVVAVLKGGKPGPVIGLRADIDALPIVERTLVPFASKETSTYNGQNVGVMHACGHDAHTAILLATAAVLKQIQSEVPGTVVFFFQPAEEGAPTGEEGGAPLMIKEGAMDDPKIQAMYGLHMASGMPAGMLAYKPGAAQASSDLFKISVQGKGSHGSMPWGGVDPIMVSAEIMTNIQTIVSRQSNLTKAPVVISVGSIHIGVRSNIIPETAEMLGTIRTLDPQMRLEVHASLKKMIPAIAESMGAKASIDIVTQTLVNYNDLELSKKIPEFLKRAAGADKVIESTWTTAAEDFSFYGTKAPSFFFSLGGLAPGKTPDQAGPHHTPDFYLDESGFIVGVKAFVEIVLSGK